MAELKSIVHVDSNKDIREITRMALQWVDSFDLIQFSSGREVLGRIGSSRPNLFLLHYSLPDMSGLMLWRKLHDVDGAEPVPCIFMTARAEDHLSEELHARGALGVISKPFDPITLGDQLRRMWGRRYGLYR